MSRLVCMKEVDYMYSEIDTTTVNQISQPGQSAPMSFRDVIHEAHKV